MDLTFIGHVETSTLELRVQVDPATATQPTVQLVQYSESTDVWVEPTAQLGGRPPVGSRIWGRRPCGIGAETMTLVFRYKKYTKNKPSKNPKQFSLDHSDPVHRLSYFLGDKEITPAPRLAVALYT